MVAGVARFLVRELHGEASGCGTVSVILTGLDVDPVTRVELFDRAAFALNQADPLGDVDRLPCRVGVPRRTCCGRETNDPAMTFEVDDGVLTTSM